MLLRLNQRVADSKRSPCRLRGRVRYWLNLVVLGIHCWSHFHSVRSQRSTRMTHSILPHHISSLVIGELWVPGRYYYKLFKFMPILWVFFFFFSLSLIAWEWCLKCGSDLPEISFSYDRFCVQHLMRFDVYFHVFFLFFIDHHIILV